MFPCGSTARNVMELRRAEDLVRSHASLCRVYLSNYAGQSLRSPWAALRRYMGSSWAVLGQFLGSSWAVLGHALGRPWVVAGRGEQRQLIGASARLLCPVDLSSTLNLAASGRLGSLPCDQQKSSPRQILYCPAYGLTSWSIVILSMQSV